MPISDEEQRDSSEHWTGWRMRAPRRPPPWWPTDEAWPPTGPRGEYAWRQMRGRFFRRIGCAFLALLVLAVLGTSSVLWLVAGPDQVRWRPFGLFPLLFIGIVVLLLFAAGRGLRRVAAPVGDLIEAAGRVESGDLRARVPERGPPEVQALARAFNDMSRRLEADEEQRKTLLAEVTHELRTPLTVVQGNLEALIDGVHPPDAAHLDAILEETRVLSRLIDDLRTLALAEREALGLQLEPTDLDLLAREAAASFKTRADAADVSLGAEAPDDFPLVEIDPIRIREVLANLISNALRYTSAGGTIRVTLSRTDGAVSVAVEDTGTGIAADELPHIFDSFYKSEESPGTGLGLAVARKIVEAHRGQISATSSPGEGTTIRFTVPLAARERDAS